MWSILVLSLIPAAYGASISANDGSGTGIYGDYQLLYVWPKTSEVVPNCAATSYKALRESIAGLSCQCGRSNVNIAIIKQDTKYIGKSVLFDVVKSDEEATAALKDKCTCDEPLNYMTRVVVLKLSDDLMLQYEKEDKLRHYIFGKKAVSEAELKAAIANIKGLKYEDGQSACDK